MVTSSSSSSSWSTVARVVTRGRRRIVMRSGSDADDDDGAASDPGVAPSRGDRRRRRVSVGGGASMSGMTMTLMSRRAPRASRIAGVVGRRQRRAREEFATWTCAGKDGRRRGHRACASDDDEDKAEAARTPLGACVTSSATDAGRKFALEHRLSAMRALPKTSRYAKAQVDMITKALELLERGKVQVRTVEEEDELAGLLKAVKL
jgi:hypothetical protein